MLRFPVFFVTIVADFEAFFSFFFFLNETITSLALVERRKVIVNKGYLSSHIQRAFLK